MRHIENTERLLLGYQVTSGYIRLHQVIFTDGKKQNSRVKAATTPKKTAELLHVCGSLLPFSINAQLLLF